MDICHNLTKFTYTCKELFEISSQTDLPDELRVNIPWLGDMSKNSTSHSHGKKKGVNVLADDSALPFLTIVFLCRLVGEKSAYSI